MKRRAFLRHSTMWAAAAVAKAAQGTPGRAWAAPWTADPLFNRSFSGLDGAPFAMAQCLGRPVVVNFWATWCPPCVKEMPDLDALHKKHDTVQFVGLAVDTKANVQAFMQRVPVSYPVLLVGHDGIALMRTLGNKPAGLPFTVVFDAKGRVVDQVLGAIKPAQLDRTIQDLLV